MSRSFLVESLLMSDDVQNANESSSSSSNKQTQYRRRVAVNHLSTRRHHKFNQSWTQRNKLLSASAHVLSGSQFDRQWPYHCGSSMSLQPYRYVCFQPMQVATALDAYVQLQTLRASQRCSESVQEMTGRGCLADMHQRSSNVNGMPQPLQLAATSFMPPCSYRHNYSEQRQQSRAEVHRNCVTSSSASQNDDSYSDKCIRRSVMSTQTTADDDFIDEVKMAVAAVSGESGRRMRTSFTSRQLLELERQFGADMYLTRVRRIEISALLRLSEKQIKVWFQNRRVKYKKQLMARDDDNDDDDDDDRRRCACLLRTCRNRRQTAKCKDLSRSD